MSEPIPKVPEGVLKGMEDVESGRTITEEDLERVLKWSDR